jgi:predicted patatin/cPLA2 family phospholipase
VVIRTIPQHHGKSCWRQRIEALGLDRVLPTTVVEMIERHEDVIEDALTFMLNPPDDLELVQIAPLETLQSSVFGSPSSALLADYGSGLRAGEAAAEKLFHWRVRIDTCAAPATGDLRVEHNPRIAIEN